jgi:hypothetical protein
MGGVPVNFGRHPHLALLLVLTAPGCGGSVVNPPAATLAPTVFDPLKQEIQKSYLELFKTLLRLTEEI